MTGLANQQRGCDVAREIAGQERGAGIERLAAVMVVSPASVRQEAPRHYGEGQARSQKNPARCEADHGEPQPASPQDEPHTLSAPQVRGWAPFGHITLQLSTLVQITVHVEVHVTLHEFELVQLMVDPAPAVTVHVLALLQS